MVEDCNQMTYTTAKLPDVCSLISSGGTPSRKRPEYFCDSEEGHLWVKSKELLDGSISMTEENITDEAIEDSSAKYYPANTILLAMYGANVGQLGWLKQKATINQAICGMVVDEDVAHWRYIFYAIMAKRRELVAKAFGAAQQNLNQEIIQTFEIPLPPLSTQRKIAAILSANDDLIENNTRRIKILEEMAQTIYREWFVKFRYPSHDKVKMVESELGMIPEGWEVKKLGDVADIQWGDTSTTKKSYVDDGFNAYSATGLDGKLDHYDFDRVGIVLSAIGANCGRTWFAKGKWSCIKNTIRFWSTSDKVSTEYLYFATLNAEYWPRRGAAQPFISQGDALKTSVILPTRELNLQFTEFANSSLDQIIVLENINSNLRQTRDLLLPKLISGELDVSELDIETGGKDI